MGHRSLELTEAAKHFNGQWDKWVDDHNREYPDASLFDDFESLFAVYESGDIPGESRPLADAVARLGREWNAYNDRPNVGDFHFHEDLKAAREALKELLHVQTIPPPKSLESIESLRKAGCTDLQIAQTYGFYDRHGMALSGLVERELANPGSVTRTPGAVDGGDWECPEGLTFELPGEKVEAKAKKTK